MGIEFVPDGDMTITKVQRLLSDPFVPPAEWEIIPLPEPVQLKAGRRYDSGFENGQPYIRELIDGEGD